MELFRQFHARAPQEEFLIDVAWEQNPEPIGEAVLIVYRSDKWNEGDHDYIHFFESRPQVYRMKEGGRGADNVPQEVAFLGGVVELHVLTDSGHVIDLGPGDLPGSPMDFPWLGAYEEDGSAKLIVLDSADLKGVC